jgi:shikimate kinase / 3-dehydroquinate synthase
MGAGKSTIGAEAAAASSRPFLDLDRELERRYGPIADLFARGEAEFRRAEEELAAELLGSAVPAVLALGGGAVTSEHTRRLLAERAHTVWLDVDADDAWQRVRGSERPLARDQAEFRRLYDERRELYALASDGLARNVEDVLLDALMIAVEPGALGDLEARLGTTSGVAVIGDEHVLALHKPTIAHASIHFVPRGETAKSTVVARRLWAELQLDREGTIVGYGGGSTTDVAGFVAATYLRGVRWIAVPTSLVGQVDAAIGGKTAIDLPAAKNLVGAFHYPQSVVVDPGVLVTLPEELRREGMAEVVKTGLLAGRSLWELDDVAMIRATAAFKAGVCLGDPYDEGRRAILNLGHTFAHALEAAGGYDAVTHGQAVALGLLAALRLSGRPTDVVEQVLAPERLAVDRDRAWTALQRDKKARAGEVNLVLLGDDGPVIEPVASGEVRRALDELVVD